MSNSSLILRPGMREPPFITPYCSNCELPVERFTFLPVVSAFYMDIDAHCCGKTRGVRVPTETIMRMKANGEKLYLPMSPLRAPGLAFHFQRAV